ncbi:ketopantoate reductase family protein [Pedobacter nutrimenti]|uniref:2-dehydropantoate 2-reductase n=1 Tax=Pedobacter nutrimenti TaxID=1241337 RepID=A0A318UIC3_9SPHI|nr:2-dehydropantoate 2-reductase [Pedobacter nutrimenti]PYF72834.1 2-dehydropantoate 2-reductase [Pedobacter nutrimenti]
MTKDHIYIIGAGAVGKVLAVALKLSGKKVTLLRGSVDKQSAYLEKIQILQDNKTELEETIEISTLSHFPELNGIVILTNKSYGNKQLAETLQQKTGTSPIVILQNGLGIEQPFLDLGFPEIYRCVLFMTSQNTNGQKISYKPVSVSPIGTIKSNNNHLQEIVEQINTVHFQFRAETDIQPVIWKKAIINSVFNSICPLLETDNGIFHRDQEVLEMAKRVIGECLAIAREKGILLNDHQVLENLLLISKFSDGQLISTLQDINNNRKTEIETLNFEIVRIAGTLHKENLVRETKLLGELTRIKSDLKRNPEL